MMKDISGHMALMNVTIKKEQMDKFVQKKIGTDTMASEIPK